MCSRGTVRAVLLVAVAVPAQAGIAQSSAAPSRVVPASAALPPTVSISTHPTGSATLSAARITTCLAGAAAHHAVDPQLLRAIAMVESGLDAAAVNRANANGSRDLGLMQINSAWLPALARWRITENDLFDPCVSAYVGAWILAGNIARLGPTWQAVGAYNARTPSRQLAYVKRVQKQLARQSQAWGAGALARAP